MNNFFIAQIGRTIGLWGELKLHLHTDFPEQFKVGASFESNHGTLSIKSYNPQKGTICFVGFEDIDSAKKLTNTKLYASLKQTKELCALNDGEYFWFDIIGCEVVQNGETLGAVEEIQRLVDVDYMHIKTAKALVDEEMPKHFLLPYIARYVLGCDMERKVIEVQDAKDVLEAS